MDAEGAKEEREKQEGTPQIFAESAEKAYKLKA